VATQPVMCSHPCPKRVFIGGGGEGATLREVLRHATVEECVMVDIDGDVVNYCRDHMPGHSAGVYKDPRATLVIDDCKVQLEGHADGSFDVIIMDLSDPLDGGPCYQLYTTAFYTTILAKLAPGGIFVTQSGCGSTLDADRCFTCVHSTLKQVFPKVWGYTCHVPSFTSEWSFNIAWKDADSQVRRPSPLGVWVSLFPVEWRGTRGCDTRAGGRARISPLGATSAGKNNSSSTRHRHEHIAAASPLRTLAHNAGLDHHRFGGHHRRAHRGAEDGRQPQVVRRDHAHAHVQPGQGAAREDGQRDARDDGGEPAVHDADHRRRLPGEGGEVTYCTDTTHRARGKPSRNLLPILSPYNDTANCRVYWVDARVVSGE
jgi:hypothetical protein